MLFQANYGTHENGQETIIEINQQFNIYVLIDYLSRIGWKGNTRFLEIPTEVETAIFPSQDSRLFGMNTNDYYLRTAINLLSCVIPEAGNVRNICRWKSNPYILKFEFMDDEDSWQTHELANEEGIDIKFLIVQPDDTMSLVY